MLQCNVYPRWLPIYCQGAAGVRGSAWKRSSKQPFWAMGFNYLSCSHNDLPLLPADLFSFPSSIASYGTCTCTPPSRRLPTVCQCAGEYPSPCATYPGTHPPSYGGRQVSMTSRLACRLEIHFWGSLMNNGTLMPVMGPDRSTLDPLTGRSDRAPRQQLCSRTSRYASQCHQVRCLHHPDPQTPGIRCQARPRRMPHWYLRSDLIGCL